MSDRSDAASRPRGIDPRGPRFAAGITSLLLLIAAFLGLTGLSTSADLGSATRRRAIPRPGVPPAARHGAPLPVGRPVAAHRAVGRAVPHARAAPARASRPTSRILDRRASPRAWACSSSASVSCCTCSACRGRCRSRLRWRSSPHSSTPCSACASAASSTSCSSERESSAASAPPRLTPGIRRDGEERGGGRVARVARRAIGGGPRRLPRRGRAARRGGLRRQSGRALSRVSLQILRGARCASTKSGMTSPA